MIIDINEHEARLVVNMLSKANVSLTDPAGAAACVSACSLIEKIKQAFNDEAKKEETAPEAEADKK